MFTRRRHTSTASCSILHRIPTGHFMPLFTVRISLPATFSTGSGTCTGFECTNNTLFVTPGVSEAVWESYFNGGTTVTRYYNPTGVRLRKLARDFALSSDS